jgi:hypothetical protein
LRLGSDPVETRIRGRVRGFIDELIEARSGAAMRQNRCMLFWAPLPSGPIVMREIAGWNTLSKFCPLGH